ncbi:hypothetical protein Mapa_006855 [Marchantia paleacea]|nr:hypothetical protein Mapa_006855 [Marchantia paleacea]
MFMPSERRFRCRSEEQSVCMRFEADDKQRDDYVVIDHNLVVDLDEGSLPSTPNMVVCSEPEASEASERDVCRNHAEFVQRMMQLSRSWPRGRTAHRLLHRNPPVEGDDRFGLCTRSRSLSDHFHARFGDRLHRFKPAPSRGNRLRKRAMSADIPGVSSTLGSEQATCHISGSSGGRSVVGRGHNFGRPGRYLRHLGCHRRWYRQVAEAEMKSLADAQKELYICKDLEPLKFKSFKDLDQSWGQEGQNSAASSAADIVARLSLNDHVKPAVNSDTQQQMDVPIFEVSKLSLSDAPVG